MSQQQILLKMQQGTPRGDAHLCASCVNAMIRRGVNASGDLQLCTVVGNYTGGRGALISGQVAACSSYYPKHLPPLHELHEIAWEIVSRGGRRIGFISPEERRAAGIGMTPAQPPSRFSS